MTITQIGEILKKAGYSMSMIKKIRSGAVKPGGNKRDILFKLGISHEAWDYPGGVKAYYGLKTQKPPK